MAKSKGWAPKQGKGKKTSIGQGKRSKFKAIGSGGTVPKGYRKRYRGQGK
jgi:hypothetical protein|tara:strand:- start:386 stop:535 length:150 start_codon:yes stop_codon:yes gene_type:complete